MKKETHKPDVGCSWRSMGPWLLAVTAPLYVLDQVTKFAVTKVFPDPPPGLNYTPDKVIEVIPGFLNWVRVHNQGVAFGMGNGTDWAPLFFPVISVAAFTLIFFGLRKGFFVGWVGKLAVALLLTGIAGNLTDRLIQGSRLERMAGEPLWERLKAGYVVDFIDVVVPWTKGWHWPSFNVADSCICVAAVLIFLSGWRSSHAQGA